MATTWNVIYLGNPGITLDPTEGNNTAENASQILATNTVAAGSAFGSFGSAANPLNRQVFEAEAVNVGGPQNNGQNVMDNDNNVANDFYRIDLNRDGTTETYIHDVVIYYNATITYADGRPPANIEARIIQTTSGDIFLAPSIGAGDIASLTAGPIQSLTLNSIANNTNVAFVQDRPLNAFVPCFALGTKISTPDGQRRVETLRAGDLVETLDHGAKPVVWVGQVSVAVAKNEKLRPIRISKGALGDNQPAQDLFVSPQHRVLVRSKIAERMFNTAEVLIAAKHLLAVDGIDTATDIDLVTYVHFLFDQHEVVTANGALTESMFTGAEALKAVSKAAREEILTLFPALADGTLPHTGSRQFVAGQQGRNMADRHVKNGLKLVQGTKAVVAEASDQSGCERAG